MRDPHISRAAVKAAVLVGAIAPAEPPPARPGPISLEELAERGVAGRLGQRLGTVVEVTCEVVENTADWKAAAGEPYAVRFDAVDGRPLTPPVEFLASNVSGLARDVQIGARLRCVGYESGAFAGVIQLPDDPPIAHDGFGFRVQFNVLKQESRASGR